MHALSVTDVLIVGAGTTGLTTACELIRRGIAVRIVDKNDGIVMTSRAVGLHGRSMEILDDLGIDADFHAIGEPLRAASIMVDGALAKRQEFPDLDRRFPWNVTLPQHRTEALLEARLTALGGKVERNTRLVGLDERADGLAATLAREDLQETLEARWVIGCDGAHSTVRHLNRQHFPGEAEPRCYFLADVIAEGPFPRNEMTQWVSRHGTLITLPLPDGRYQVVGDLHDVSEHDPSAGPGFDRIQALVSERTGGRGTLRDPVWITEYRVHYRLTPHYRHGRTFLAGDAAHVHSPIGARGMNCGIQDAQNLAWKLAMVIEGKAPHALLHTYEAERRPAAAANLAWTRASAMPLVGYKHFTPGERAGFIDRLKSSISAGEAIDRYLQMLEVDTTYPGSLVCRTQVRDRQRHAAFLAGPRPGRLAECEGRVLADGASMRLADLLRGPRFTLLAFAGSAPETRDVAGMSALIEAFGERFSGLVEALLVVPGHGAAAGESGGVRVIGDPGGAMHQSYGAVEPGLYLVRPDGYVAFRNQPPTLVALRDFMDGAFSCAAPRG